MMDALIQNFFNIDIFRQALPYLMSGLLVTFQLCLIVIPLGLVGGFLIGCLSWAGGRGVKATLIVLIDIARSFPPLVLLIFVYYGLPFLGLDLTQLWAVCLALVLNVASFYGEIFRSGFAAIPGGQIEAARASGMSSIRILQHIVTPQAVRNVMADLVGNTIEVVKSTSLASAVALPELLRQARVVQGLTYNPTPLIAAALIYLIILWPCVRLLSRLERKEMVSM